MLFAWVTNQWLDQYEGSISIITLRVESDIYAQIEKQIYENSESIYVSNRTYHVH